MSIGIVRFNTARSFLIVPLLALVAWGLTMIYSTTFALTRGETGFVEDFFMKRQLVWLAVGGIMAGILWQMDYRKWERAKYISLILLALPLGYLALASILWSIPAARDFILQLPMIPFRYGRPLNGAFRWLRIGSVSIQPSEFVKPLLIFYLASHFRLPLRTENFKRGVLAPLLVCGSFLGLTFAGRDLSTTVIIGAIVGTMLFIAGMRLRYLFALFLLGCLFVGLVLMSSPFRRKRVADYLSQRDQGGRGGNEQVLQAQMAMGSGGKAGLGFTQSRFKRLGLPEAHTDFIVAIVGEEAGFLGVTAVLLAYVLMSAGIFWIAAQAADPFGHLICTGVGLLFALQSFINVSVVSGFCPTTGVTAPFLSYGGSSMISCLLCVGMVMSVSRVAQREAYAVGDSPQADSGPDRRLNLQRKEIQE
ncbi:MAG: putative peptidoglycan glycosyltransferase FtsW [Lentisphaeria bacterium]|jgi:cell division protein FtsW|nr:putative peptidoglycan glycosyltransferase FtsW [Lentisphaeria bacterium]